MNAQVKSRLLALVALISGLVVLTGYFIDLPWLAQLQGHFLSWAMILAAMALLLGVYNLARAHWRKITGRSTHWMYSLVLLVVLATTLAVGLAYGPTGRPAAWIFSAIVMPAEISLLAGLAVTLGVLAAGLLARGWNWFRAVLLITALFTLLGAAGALSDILPGFSKLQYWVSAVLGVGAGRGLLLGVALGALAAGLKAIAGIDRPYGR